MFAAEPPLDDERAGQLLSVADEFLRTWAAHGQPLTCGREWLSGRFLVIAVDPAAADASGCSIDGLYRKLKEFEQLTGVSLLTRDGVFYRDAEGEVRSATRDEFARMASDGSIDADTCVFDTSITSLGEWRQRFELPAAGSWHRALLTV